MSFLLSTTTKITILLFQANETLLFVETTPPPFLLNYLHRSKSYGPKIITDFIGETTEYAKK